MLLDVVGALDALPDLPLGGESLVAPTVALTSGKASDFESIPAGITNFVQDH